VPENVSSRWQLVGAWADVAAEGRHGRAGEPGIRITPREGLALATIIGRAHRAAELDSALLELVGAALPMTPRVAQGREADLIWSGPHHWLLVSGQRNLVPQLAAELAGLAAVADQSDARGVLRVAGPRVRDVLAKGCPIDLHPTSFAPGDAALTSIAHIGVQLWQVDDAPTYDLAVFRSMAASFWSWLTASAAEYGYDVSA
jgi:sarcosine oxidase subunit gamma